MKAKPLLLTVLLLFALCTPLALTNIPIGFCAESDTILVSYSDFNETDVDKFNFSFIATPSYRIRIDNLLVNTSSQQLAIMKFPTNASGDTPALDFSLAHEDDGRLIIDWVEASAVNLATVTDFVVKESAYDIEIICYPNKIDVQYWNGTEYVYALEDYELACFDIGDVWCYAPVEGGFSSGHMSITIMELTYGGMDAMFDELVPMLMYLMVIGAVCGMIGGVTKKMGKW